MEKNRSFISLSAPSSLLLPPPSRRSPSLSLHPSHPHPPSRPVGIQWAYYLDKQQQVGPLEPGNKCLLELTLCLCRRPVLPPRWGTEVQLPLVCSSLFSETLSSNLENQVQKIVCPEASSAHPADLLPPEVARFSG